MSGSGFFDDLIPGTPARSRSGMFDDLLPGGAPAAAERPAEDVKPAAVETPASPGILDRIKQVLFTSAPKPMLPEPAKSARGLVDDVKAALKPEGPAGVIESLNAAAQERDRLDPTLGGPKKLKPAPQPIAQQVGPVTGELTPMVESTLGQRIKEVPGAFSDAAARYKAGLDIITSGGNEQKVKQAADVMKELDKTALARRARTMVFDKAGSVEDSSLVAAADAAPASLAAMAGTILAGPGGAALAVSPAVAPDRYSKTRQLGGSIPEALAATVADVGQEAGTEAIGLGFLRRLSKLPAKVALAKAEKDPRVIPLIAGELGISQGGEQVSEQTSNLMGWLIDKATGDPEATLGKLLDDAKQTAEVTALLSAGTGGATLVGSGVRRALTSKPNAETHLEPAGAPPVEEVTPPAQPPAAAPPVSPPAEPQPVAQVAPVEGAAAPVENQKPGMFDDLVPSEGDAQRRAWLKAVHGYEEMADVPVDQRGAIEDAYKVFTAEQQRAPGPISEVSDEAAKTDTEDMAELEALRMPAEVKPQVAKVMKVVDHATTEKRAPGQPPVRTAYRTIDEEEAAKIEEAIGEKVAGFEHVIDEDVIRHALKNQGKVSTDERHDRVPLTKEDFEKVPLVVDAKLAKVTPGGRKINGNPTLVYERQLGDTYYAVEVVRKKQRRMALVTMSKTRAVPRATPEGGVAQTSETPSPDSNDSLDLPNDEGNLGMPGAASTTISPPISPPILPGTIAAGAGGTTPAKTVGKDQARPDAIRAAMRTLFGAPLSEKGLSKKYLGIYKIKPQTIRLQNRNDLRTAAHEIGHHISNLNRPFRKIMRAHQPELVSIAPRAYLVEATKKYGSVQAALKHGEMRRHLVEEGFAEFIAEYLNDPTTLKAKVPSFHAAFEAWLKANPTYAEALGKVQDMIGAHQALSPEEKILAKVGAFKPTLGERVSSALSMDTWNAFTQSTLDKWAPLKSMVADLAPGLAASKNPYLAARLLSGDSAIVEDWVSDFTSPFDYAKRLDSKNYGKPLKAILEPIIKGGDEELNKFKAYLIARRAAELRKRGKENLITPQEIAAGLKLETGQPGRAKLFEATANEVYAYNDRLLDYAVEGGLIAEETAAKFREYANYIPFFREPEGEAKGGGGRGDPFKRLTGGTANLRDPIANLIQNTANIVHATNRNAMVAKAVELAKAVPGGGRWLEAVKVPQEAHNLATKRIIEQLEEQGVKVDTSMAGDMAAMQTFFTPSGKGDDRTRTIVYKDGGELKAVQVNDPLLWRTLGNIAPLQMNLIWKILAAPAQTLRAGVVLDPTFMVRNFVRDTLSGMIQSKGGFVPFYSTGAGAIQAGKQWWYGAAGKKLADQTNDSYKLWRAFGGSFGDQFREPEESAKILERMAARGNFSPGSIITPTRWLDALRRLGSFAESGSRIAEFEATYKPGDIDSALQAALNAREVSTDFGMRGGSEAIQVLTRITPFMNPAMQGLYKTARVLSAADGRGTAVKAAVLGTSMALVSIALALLHSDEDWYQQIEEWEKTTYWHFKIGDNVYRIPKPFEYGTLFASIPEAIALHQAGKEDGETFKKRMLQALGQIFGFRVIPQVATILAEPWANKSFFTGRKLVPDRQERMEPGLQSGPQTSKVAQVAGQAANVSPAIIDNVVRNVFGTIGVHAETVADLLLEQTGTFPQGKERGWQTWPAIKAFVRDPDNPNTKQQRDFYEQLEKYRTAVNSVREMKERGEEAKAETYAAEKAEELALAKGGEHAAKKLSKIRKAVRAIDWDRDMTPAEKREAINEKNAEAQDIATEQTLLYQAAKKSYARPAIEGAK